MQKPVFIIKQLLLLKEEYFILLNKICNSKKLTNVRQLHQELERKLAKYLGVKYLSLLDPISYFNFRI